ncbi:MAG: rRNA pseudouridine synthase, partial [Chitinophagales bacterium]|nr:rRNA pseudouridine synthase [Chitinophagales bacterium]
MRLNKFISNAGVCSRRQADEYIKAGYVTVNDVAVLEMGYKVKPSDIVKFKNRKVQNEKKVYVLLNKPKGYLTTVSDDRERKTVMELVSTVKDVRLYPVGRLDRNSTGILLMTNDGELAQKLSHPSGEVTKVYQVELDKPLDQKDLLKIREGVELEDGKANV